MAAQFTTAGHNLLRSGGSVLPTYVAIGTGNSTPTAGQTKLDAEVFRKAIAGYTNGADGIVTANAVLGSGDAVGVNIAEVAWFAGEATATANSGTMIARDTSYTHTKGSESLQLPLTLTFS